MRFRWPYVSRRAFDLVLEERDRLRVVIEKQADRLVEQGDKFFEHVKRIDRIEHGVGELERQPRKELGPMPVLVKEYLDGIGNASIRKFVEAELYKRSREGQAWESIQTEVRKTAEQQAEAADATAHS